ncbi:MAG: hypothetical protein [Caudoviricetes sp.]|nr:MAG: hypothetical protein [Caudoviricetes sp.]
MRQEPTIGTKITSFFGQNKTLNHGKIVENALEAFKTAEKGIEDAIKVIETDVELEQKAIKESEQRIADADGHKDRLTRVLDRVRKFTE